MTPKDSLETFDNHWELTGSSKKSPKENTL